jgi:hypothetical protein
VFQIISSRVPNMVVAARSASPRLLQVQLN